MWQGAGIFRNATDLNKTLETINNLSHANIRAESLRNLAECSIIQNMCLTASLICRSALIRKESRGAHVRMDVKQTHDARTLTFWPYVPLAISRRYRTERGGYMKTLTVRVRRFDPEKDKESHFETYTVNVNEGARVLHVLHAIHDELDPTLSFRHILRIGPMRELCSPCQWRTGACLHGRGSK